MTYYCKRLRCYAPYTILYIQICDCCVKITLCCTRRVRLQFQAYNPRPRKYILGQRDPGSLKPTILQKVLQTFCIYCDIITYKKQSNRLYFLSFLEMSKQLARQGIVHSAPQTDATTFVFASLSILLCLCFSLHPSSSLVITYQKCARQHARLK